MASKSVWNRAWLAASFADAARSASTSVWTPTHSATPPAPLRTGTARATIRRYDPSAWRSRCSAW